MQHALLIACLPLFFVTLLGTVISFRIYQFSRRTLSLGFECPYNYQSKDYPGMLLGRRQRLLAFKLTPVVLSTGFAAAYEKVFPVSWNDAELDRDYQRLRALHRFYYGFFPLAFGWGFAALIWLIP